MTVKKEGKRFARFVNRILIEERITEKEFTRRLFSWSTNRVRSLLKGEIALDRGIKIEVAKALGLKQPELRQLGHFTGFESLTDDELDSLFEMDIPDSYKY